MANKIEITRTINGNTLTLALRGQLDTATAKEVEAELQKGLDGATSLIWDFSELEYITSAGLRLLLISEDMTGEDGSATVIHANEAIRHAFSLTGLDDFLGEE